jgi:hypothetical protein
MLQSFFVEKLQCKVNHFIIVNIFKIAPKRSNLELMSELRKAVNKFVGLSPGPCIIKLIMTLIYGFRNKL